MTQPVPARSPITGSPPDAARPLRPYSRRIWEPLTTAAMFLGFVMLFQPLWLALYSASFGVILFGVLGFVVAGRLPE